MSTAESSEDNRTLLDYCQRFSELKVNRTQKRGNAPYKPILLLSVIDLITQGFIQENRVLISDRLISTFDRYWEILNSGSFNGGLALPFFHLKNEKQRFWHLQYSSDYDGGRPQTINKLRHDVDYASLDDELFELLQDSNSCQELIDALIEAWFSSKQEGLEAILRVNRDFQDYPEEVEVQDTEQLKPREPKYSFKKSLVRTTFFRKSVVHLYDYQCALCRLRITKTLNQNLVDGAHIKPLAKFYDSRLDNGISLCKNHHWAFDHGLFSINDDYKIIVGDNFQEFSPNTKPIREFRGEPIQLPSDKKCYPRIEALQWHRKNVLKA